jgi:hypothetical protein
LTGKNAVDPRIAVIVAAAPPLTAEQCSTIAALGRSIAASANSESGQPVDRKAGKASHH